MLTVIYEIVEENLKAQILLLEERLGSSRSDSDVLESTIIDLKAKVRRLEENSGEAERLSYLNESVIAKLEGAESKLEEKTIQCNHMEQELKEFETKYENDMKVKVDQFNGFQTQLEDSALREVHNYGLVILSNKQCF